jgi:UrcA family protein
MNRIAIIAAAAVSASLMTAAPAAAQEHAITVYYGDLDTTSKAGAKVLGERVKTSVDRACQRPDTRDIKGNLAWQECRDAAYAEVAEQLARQGLPITVG